MRLLWCIVLALLVVESTPAQRSELAQQHALLTSDCKAVRGHARRIVEEASASDLNTSVASAHCGEVVKALTSLEKRLQGTKKLLDANQAKSVAAEYAALEKLCQRLKHLSTQLEQELSKNQPDRFLVRKLALDLRNEMTSGSEIHENIKNKLGVK
jgi:transposase